MELLSTKYSLQEQISYGMVSKQSIQEQILYGSLLGDGHIEKGRKYKETHSIKQKEYALWKSELLEATTQIRKHSINNEREEIHIYKTIHIQISKEQIFNKLKSVGLAVWYCDDGCNVYGGCRIACCSFNDEEIRSAIAFFLRLGIRIKVRYDRGKYPLLCFNSENKRNLFEIISPYVPKCMEYKIKIPENKLNQIREYHRNKQRTYYKKKYLKVMA